MTKERAIDKRLQKALDIMESSSYMTLDENEENFLLFSTRDHGDILAEEHSDKDYEHAYRMAKVLREEGFKASLEAVDEWVMLSVHKDKIKEGQDDKS